VPHSPSTGEAIFAGWDEAAVLRLRLRVPAPAEWERYFDPNIFGGGIFVPTGEPPEVGAPVRVEITFAGGPRFFVRGMVTWRRPKLADARARAGVGVQVHPAERNKIAYVNGWVRGTVTDQRHGRRLPVKLMVTYSARTGRRINFTRDLHAEGLFLRSRELLDSNTPIRVVIAPPGHAPLDLRGRVTRVVREREEQGMGIKLLFADDAQRARFIEVVEDLERQFLAGELPDEMVS
jgi:Tfp pilus assembly protein PilZ